MKKNIVIALFLVFTVIPSVYAQRERNYIYIFDCTSSMFDGVTPNYLKQHPELFEQDNLYTKTKAWLKEDIEKIPMNSSTTITILPFHQNPGSAITFIRKDYKWNKISETLDKWVKSSHSTGICNAWDKALGYIDPEKDNYFFLLTDGAENVVRPNGCEAVAKRIKEWCVRTSKNSYAYYVALSPEAYKTCPSLKDAAEACDRVMFIDKHIGPFGSFTTNEITINSRALKDKRVSFSAEGNYDVEISCNDPYYSVDIKDGKIINGVMTVQFSEKSRPTDEKYYFHFSVTSDGNKVQITNPDFEVTVDNKENRNVDIVSEEVNGGNATYYPKFLFWKAKKPDTVTVDLDARWNSIARKEGSCIDMEVDCKKLDSKDYVILYNGKPVTDGRFSISSDDKESQLAITFSPSVKSGKYIFDIKGKGHNLESINDERTSQYENSVRLRNVVEWNPLAIILTILGLVLLAALILWFVLLKQIFYPTFKVGRYQISQPYFSQRSIRGARKVVFTNSQKRQSGINALFTGKIIYECNPFWTNEWIMVPSVRKGCRVTSLSPTYSIDPFCSTMDPQTLYTIENNNTKETCQISVF